MSDDIGKPRKRRLPVAQMNMIGLTLYTYYVYFCVAFNGGALLPGSQTDGLGFFSRHRAHMGGGGRLSQSFRSCLVFFCIFMENYLPISPVK